MTLAGMGLMVACVAVGTFVAAALRAYLQGGTSDMGKRRKDKRNAAAGAPAGVVALRVSPELAALLTNGGVADSPSFAAVLADAAADPRAARTWGVQCAVAGPGAAERDGVAVVALKPDPNNWLVDGRPMRPLLIAVYDADPDGGVMTEALDVEDVKRLMNALGEAVALAEAEATA